MAGLKNLEFFLLRYVPDAIKDEFVNIGVVILEPDSDGRGFADVRFTRDWRRVRCLDPQADVEMLQALEAEVRRQLTDAPGRAAILQKLGDSFSNLLQLSPAKAVLAEDPVKELGALASLYLETSLPAVKRALSGRQAILGHMTEALESAGVLRLMLHNIAVAPYTKAGDPFKFDFGYPVGNEIKLLQAVSLKAGVDHAVALAVRFPGIARGIHAKRGTDAHLLAVVDDELDSREEIGFALGMMEENRIRIARAAEMPAIAQQIRQELQA
ncbi:MAG: DUF3037 domain-containing protein [Acidobacteria bacterium]|nr:DUF3037 domain-containing protein [Acidobacteriota bacterium]